MKIRLAQPLDVHDIHRLIYELAVYEKAPEEMVTFVKKTKVTQLTPLANFGHFSIHNVSPI